MMWDLVLEGGTEEEEGLRRRQGMGQLACEVRVDGAGR